MSNEIDNQFNMIGVNTRLIRKIMKEATIESSSDLIVTLAEIGNQTQNFLRSLTESILQVEYTNWHDDWSANVNHINKHLLKLDSDSIRIIQVTYEDFLTYFLNDDIMTSFYPMDKKDHLGWKIYKELDEKRQLCKKILAIREYQETYV